MLICILRKINFNMTTKELTELVDECRTLLIRDFKATNKKEPTQKDLLNHIKILCKNGDEETILNDLFLDDVDCPEDFYKLLFIFSAFKS